MNLILKEFIDLYSEKNGLGYDLRELSSEKSIIPIFNKEKSEKLDIN